MKRNTPIKRYTPIARSRTPIRRVSSKRSKQLREYTKRRAIFLAANPLCAVYKDLRSAEVHHVAGRIGEKLNDEKDWLAVSRAGHVWIHNNPRQARELGLLK